MKEIFDSIDNTKTWKELDTGDKYAFLAILGRQYIPDIELEYEHDRKFIKNEKFIFKHPPLKIHG